MKRAFILCITLLFIGIFSMNAFAAQQENISISILSPHSAEGYPGLEQTITAQITNNTDQPIDDVMVYITMADLNKHMTVNLEDYGADKPAVVGTLAAHEVKTVELPVRLVYVSKFYLYTTVVSSISSQIVSSNAIPIQIWGNTMIDKNIVQIVATSTPIAVLLCVSIAFFKKRKTHKV